MELEYLFSTCFIQNHQFQVYQVLPWAFSLVRRHHPSKGWPHVMCSSLKPPKSPMLGRLFCCHYWMGIVCSWNGFKLDPYLKPCKDGKFKNLTLGTPKEKIPPRIEWMWQVAIAWVNDSVIYGSYSTTCFIASNSPRFPPGNPLTPRHTTPVCNFAHRPKWLVEVYVVRIEMLTFSGARKKWSRGKLWGPKCCEVFHMGSWIMLFCWCYGKCSHLTSTKTEPWSFLRVQHVQLYYT